MLNSENACVLLAGVGTYTHSCFASLPATVRDAQAIAAILTARPAATIRPSTSRSSPAQMPPPPTSAWSSRRYSDFHVWLTRSNGAWLTEIKRDGFRSCYGNLPPPPGYDLGWRTASYDLSAFKGQTVRVVFENRNLHSGSSWGIWTYVDDVRVVDAGPLPTPPGPYRAYLPVTASSAACDPVVYGLGVESVVRPGRP